MNWISFEDQQPTMGMFVQVEINCHLCNNAPYRLECIWGLNNSERYNDTAKDPCLPEFIKWRHIKPGETHERKVHAREFS